MQVWVHHNARNLQRAHKNPETKLCSASLADDVCDHVKYELMSSDEHFRDMGNMDVVVCGDGFM